MNRLHWMLALSAIFYSASYAEQPLPVPEGKPELIQVGEFAHGGHTMLELGRRSLVAGGNLLEALTLPPPGSLERAFRKAHATPKGVKIAGRALMVLAALATVDEVYVYSNDKAHWKARVLEQIERLDSSLRILNRPIQLAEGGPPLTRAEVIDTYRRLVDEVAKEDPSTLARVWDVGMNFIPILPIFLEAETPGTDNLLAYSYARIHAEVEALRNKLDLINADSARRRYIESTRAFLAGAKCAVYFVCEHDALPPGWKRPADRGERIPYFLETTTQDGQQFPRLRRVEVPADLLAGGVDPVLAYRRVVEHITADQFLPDACFGMTGTFDPRHVLSSARGLPSGASNALLERVLSVARECGETQEMSRATVNQIEALDHYSNHVPFTERATARLPVTTVFVMGSQIKIGEVEMRWVADSNARQRSRQFLRAFEDLSHINRNYPNADPQPYPYSIGPRP